MKAICKRIKNGFVPFPALALTWGKDTNNTRRYDVELLFLVWYVDIKL